MKRFFLLLSALSFSTLLMAQTEMPVDAAPSDDMSGAQSQEGAVSETPEARIERECGEWAVQDGVPADELPTYISDCVEDRKAQE